MNVEMLDAIEPSSLVKERYDFNDFIRMVRLLRSPEGCPWDREQTHASIRKNFIEETYEVLEAIDNGDLSLLREELGDVLLQIGLHVEMESELGRMSFEDVITELCKKLVQRHPHVFGDVAAENVPQVLNNWETIKMRTKGQSTYEASLRSVPASFPALMRAQKLLSRAARAGFAPPDVQTALAQADVCQKHLCRSSLESASADVAERALGDSLFALVGLAQQLGIDAEEALTRSGQRFTERFAKMERAARKQNKSLHELSYEEQCSLFAAEEN
jgi:tetrapyrrole methylase family protein/MazG family protein